MYGNHHNRRMRAYPHNSYLRCNSVIVAVLTIVLTALTAYFLAVIATNSTLKRSPATNATKNFDRTKWLEVVTGERLGRRGSSNLDPREISIQLRPKNDFVDVKAASNNQSAENQSVVIPNGGWQPLVEASEVITSQVLKPPDNVRHMSKRLQSLRVQLAALNRSDLLQLIKLLQDHVGRLSVVSLKKRHVEEIQQTNSSSSTKESTLPKEPVVVRSSKMNRLVAYLDKIESNIPAIDYGKLEKLSALDDEKSIVRIVAPGTVDTIFKSNDVQIGSNLKGQEKANLKNIVPWLEKTESVAPNDADWQQEVVEDWPSPSTTVKPRKKKKRKKVVVSTTSTTTTTSAPETTTTTTTVVPLSSQAPPQAFEEVWIEEEEDIVRPPKRKLKKYKKKTTQQDTTTIAPVTSTTTTTTTTTTTAPFIKTTTVLPEEDWPDDPWPPASSTKSPELWPKQETEEDKWPKQHTEEEKWPKQETEEEEGEKWPEEEWLDELKNDVQRRVHVIYN